MSALKSQQIKVTLMITFLIRLHFKGLNSNQALLIDHQQCLGLTNTRGGWGVVMISHGDHVLCG